MTAAISGKYFLGVHNECMRSGVVDAAVNDDHYLVRFDDLIGFADGSKWPEALASRSVSGRRLDCAPPWRVITPPPQGPSLKSGL
jgi:hypothetical protein